MKRFRRVAAYAPACFRTCRSVERVTWESKAAGQLGAVVQRFKGKLVFLRYAFCTNYLFFFQTDFASKIATGEEGRLHLHSTKK